MTGWVQAALLGVFQKEPLDEVKDELALRDEAQFLDELVDLAIHLDNRMRE